MAMTKRLCLIYEIQNFADTYLGKVIKFQGNGSFRFGVLSHLLSWRWKTPLGANMVKFSYLIVMNGLRFLAFVLLKFLVSKLLKMFTLASSNVR